MVNRCQYDFKIDSFVYIPVNKGRALVTSGTMAGRSLSLTPVSPDPVICYRKNPTRSLATPLALKAERNVLRETRAEVWRFKGKRGGVGGKKIKKTNKGGRDGEKGRDVTPEEMEEYQYHASLPSLLESLPSRLFSLVPYYRLGKIIFEYVYPSDEREPRNISRSPFRFFACFSRARNKMDLQNPGARFYRRLRWLSIAK